MYNNNQPIFTPDTNTPQNFVPLTPDAPKKNKKKLFFIIGGVVLLVVAALLVYFLVLRKPASEETGTDELGEESIITPGINEADIIELEETFVNEADRGSFVDYNMTMINYGNAEESFNGRLDLAGYYISVGDFGNAEPLLVGIDTSAFTTEQNFRYYNVLTRYYDGIGDASARDDANTRASEFRNLLQQESAGN